MVFLHRLLLTALLSLAAFPVLALDFERLFSPGELIEGHRKLEGDCKQCHVRLRDVSENQLCRDCHEEVDDDIKRKKGFHGKHPKAGSEDCKTCHTDHKGRDADIVNLDRDRFDHAQTDFRLTGKHRVVNCDSCHKPEKKFREAPGKCIDCHKDDDVHEGKLGKKCQSCHNPKSWSQENFDHDKTDFKLRYGHKEVACDLCHVGNRYKDTPKNCASCHAIKDVHGGRFGNRCQDCHSEKKWSKTRFNHDRLTRFRLKGKHRQVACHACHDSGKKTLIQRNKAKRSRPRKCIDCHKLDDVHKGSNGKRCDQCHNEQSWLKTEFDHDKETDFALRGAHRKTACQACHREGEARDKTPTDCLSCHLDKDVHEQKLGKKCQSCHGEKSWVEEIRFDHELTEFPLIGQHAAAGCESCHDSLSFQSESRECKDCHAADDTHEKTLGQQCERCHNPNDWLIWSFDHDRDSDFPLKGAHETVHCSRCHRRPMPEQPRTRKCISCHKRDDVHDGNFGPDCGECHTEKNFRELKADKFKSISGRAF
jgi:hypothetical protein